jgi:hypothetical protein
MIYIKTDLQSKYFGMIGKQARKDLHARIFIFKDK